MRDKKHFYKKIDVSLLILSLVLLVSVAASGIIYYKAQAMSISLPDRYVLSAQTVAQNATDKDNSGLQMRTFSPPPTVPPTVPPAVRPPTNPQTRVAVTAPPVTRTPCSETPGGCTVTLPPPVPTKVRDCNREGPPPCCAGVSVTAQGPLGPTLEPGPWCDSKPVIYLYPTEKTTVSVKLDLPGRVTESIPPYQANGWQNITAYPGGRLMYQGKEYKELYYESAIDRVVSAPTQGIVAKPSDYQKTLIYFGTNLGLNKTELAEFVSYWEGRLSRVQSPYMFFSYYPLQDKEKIDGVTISPKPDTRIEFIMYFKPLQTKEHVASPVFAHIPSRQGFTEVEWGGILSN